MELTDLLPVEKWIEIEKEIQRRSGLDASVFDVKGYRITGYKQWANPLCPTIKANDKGQSFICAVAHMNVSSQAQQNQGPVIEECDAGMVKALVPIFVNGTYIGALCGCGMTRNEGEVETFLINKITEIDEQRLETLAAEVQSLPSEELEATVQYMADTIHGIVTAFEKQGK